MNIEIIKEWVEKWGGNIKYILKVGNNFELVCKKYNNNNNNNNNNNKAENKSSL